MNYDVQLAIIANIKQSGWTALVASKSVIALKGEEHSGAESTHSNQIAVRAMAINLQNVHTAVRSAPNLDFR